MSNLSQFFQSGSATPWVSGMTVRKNQIVKSPADNEDYERITATGGGTTDPADDITNYVARSYRRCAAMVGGVLVPVTGGANTLFLGATRVVAGAIAVGARTNVVNITGRGSLDYFAAVKEAAGTLRVEVIADGRTLVDETVTITVTQGLLYIGSQAWDGVTVSLGIAIPLPDAVQFRRSLQIYLTAVTTVAGAQCGIGYIVRSEA